MIVILIFSLLVVIQSSSLPCHSSCETCSGPTATQCLTCDSTSLVLSNSSQCIGITGNTTILEIIDVNWSGGGYLKYITILGNAATTAIDIPWTPAMPLQVYQFSGILSVKLDFDNLPPNHYRIQVRSSIELNSLVPNCTWNTIDVNWFIESTDQPTIMDNYSIIAQQFNDTRTSFSIVYSNVISSQSGSCLYYTLTDFTIIAFMCSPNCATCIEYSICTSCGLIGGIQNYLNFNNTCIFPCPFSYYQIGNQFICDQCNNSCLYCLNTPNNCTQCNSLSGYVTAYNNTNSCVNFCPSGQYINTTHQSCMLCDQNCLTCIITGNYCLSCGMSAVGGQLYLSGSTCIFNCPAGTYQNTSLNICKNCDISCATCNGPIYSNCYKCANDTVLGLPVIYYLAFGTTTCNETCPQGQYINAAIPNYCQQCSSLCVDCSGNATNCLSCPTGFYLYFNSCLSTCAPGTYANVLTSQCTSCNAACATCFGAGTSSCNSCKTDSGTGIVYYLSVGTTKCVAACPVGQIKGSNNLCIVCAQQCSACSVSASNCTNCSFVNNITPVYFQNWTCVTTCSVGTYPQSGSSNNLCLQCDLSCLSCFGPLPTSCTACSNSTNATYYKDPLAPSCNTTCPQGYFGVNSSNTCQPCQTGCTSCQLTSSNCQGCQTVGGTSYYLYISSCLTVCPSTFYHNVNICSSCHVSCAVCSGPLNTQCSSCGNATINGTFTQFYLAMGTTICSLTCPQGQYIATTFPNSCQQCSSLCVTCSYNANNCTNGQCPYGLYFYNNSCQSVCIMGTYGNSSNWQCLSCNSACASCFSSGTSSCNSCQTDPATGIAYYLQLGSTICVAKCPAGQIQSTSNLCAACAQQCATCSVTQSNCTSCSLLNGVTVYLQNGTCSSSCLNGTYPKVSSSNNTCSQCDTSCLTCFGPLSTNCNSCSNSTTAIYFKDPLSSVCTPNCPQGYVGINSTNTCQQCDTGCITCLSSTGNCQQCQKIGNIFYYFFNNSCLIFCPDGTYKSNTDLTCYNCSYFTLNQQCIKQCPNGYVGIIKSQASVCEGCSSTNCSTYNQAFTIQTTIDASSKNFVHQIGLPSGLNRNCTSQSISDGLQVQLIIKNRRLLTTPILLTILSVSISSDYNTIIIVTNSQQIQISSASIAVNFRVGALITPSGVIYNSASSSVDLQNPTFIASYYNAYGKNINDQVQGIVFIIFSTFLLVIALCFRKQETVNEMVIYVQLVQMVGLMRVKAFPIALSAYNVLIGFSYYEMQYITNPLIYFIPGFTLRETASDPTILVYGSQNFIFNFGSLFCIATFMLLIAFLVKLAFRDDEQSSKTVKMVIKAIIEYFLFIVIYGCILSLISLGSNTLTDSNVLFASSIIVSLVVIILCMVYFIKHSNLILQKQFYKITHFIKIVCLIILGYRIDIAAICFNSFQLITIVAEAWRYGASNSHPFLRTTERISVLVLINICIFAKDSTVLILAVGPILAFIGCLKIYYLMQTIFAYYQKEDSEAISQKSQGLKLQQNQSNIFNNSQNYFFEETISEKNPQKNLEKQMESINQMRQPCSRNLQADTLINGLQTREQGEIVTKRKRKIRKIKPQQNQQVIVNGIEELNNEEIIKIEPKFQRQKRIKRNQLILQAEMKSSNNDNMEIISAS